MIFISELCFIKTTSLPGLLNIHSFMYRKRSIQKIVKKVIYFKYLHT